MRLVVQRVEKASVSVGDDIVGKIGKGYLVLLGVKKGDTKAQALSLAEKLSKLRVMADGDGKMNLSVKDVVGEVLVVSQFTLYGNTSKGNRPSFIEAAEPKHARELYENFVERLREIGVKVETGSFGDYMHIGAALDGPVTILVEEE